MSHYSLDQTVLTSVAHQTWWHVEGMPALKCFFGRGRSGTAPKLALLVKTSWLETWLAAGGSPAHRDREGFTPPYCFHSTVSSMHHEHDILQFSHLSACCCVEGDRGQFRLGHLVWAFALFFLFPLESIGPTSCGLLSPEVHSFTFARLQPDAFSMIIGRCQLHMCNRNCLYYTGKWHLGESCLLFNTLNILKLYLYAPGWCPHYRWVSRNPGLS